MTLLALDHSDPLVSSRIVSTLAHDVYRYARARAVPAEDAFEAARVVEIELLRAEILRVQSARNPFRSHP